MLASIHYSFFKFFTGLVVVDTHPLQPTDPLTLDRVKKLTSGDTISPRFQTTSSYRDRVVKQEKVHPGSIP